MGIWVLVTFSRMYLIYFALRMIVIEDEGHMPFLDRMISTLIDISIITKLSIFIKNIYGGRKKMVKGLSPSVSLLPKNKCQYI